MDTSETLKWEMVEAVMIKVIKSGSQDVKLIFKTLDEAVEFEQTLEYFRWQTRYLNNVPVGWKRTANVMIFFNTDDRKQLEVKELELLNQRIAQQLKEQ